MRLALVLSEAGQGLRRNLSMVISIVLVTFVSLTFVGTAALLQLQINQMKSFWYDKAQVAMLGETLDEMPKLQREMGKMVDQWAAGKTDLIAKELNEGVTRSPEAMKVLLIDRNKRWADWI